MPEVVFASDAGGSAEGALPCLYSNNSIKEPDLEHRLSCVKALCGILSPYHKKQAQTLFANVQRLISLAPSLGHVGFLTLTTPDNCSDSKEFQRRWNSFKTSFLSRSYWFRSYIGVYERQKRGAWHLHLVVILPYDIRSGCDFDQFERRNYRSAPAVLRQLWRDLRQVLPGMDLDGTNFSQCALTLKPWGDMLGSMFQNILDQEKSKIKGKGWLFLLRIGPRTA